MRLNVECTRAGFSVSHERDGRVSSRKDVSDEYMNVREWKTMVRSYYV